MWTWDNIPEAFGNRLRVSVLGILIGGERDFAELRQLTGASDGNLSVQTGRLEEWGYLEKQRGFAGNKTRSTYRLTAKGIAEYRAYASLLARAILERGSL